MKATPKNTAASNVHKGATPSDVNKLLKQYLFAELSEFPLRHEHRCYHADNVPDHSHHALSHTLINGSEDSRVNCLESSSQHGHGRGQYYSDSNHHNVRIHCEGSFAPRIFFWITPDPSCRVVRSQRLTVEFIGVSDCEQETESEEADEDQFLLVNTEPMTFGSADLYISYRSPSLQKMYRSRTVHEMIPNEVIMMDEIRTVLEPDHAY